MSTYVLYQHAGSGNHGCEALVRTIVSTIRNIEKDARFYLVSSKVYEDIRYGLNEIKDLQFIGLNKNIRRGNINWLNLQIGKVLHNNKMQMNAKFNLEWCKKDAVFIAIGGDNYCYNKGKVFYSIDSYIKGKKILWGCSIEPNDMDKELIDHLKEFDIITARETFTYVALKKYGIKNLFLVPDTAFTLPATKKDLAETYFGINISPLIMNYVSDSTLVYENYQELVKEILNTTQDKIMFIPHVVTENNDDRSAILKLISRLNIPKDRYILVEDDNCMELKGYITHCRFFVGARTHATIAAYSSNIPTLVVGYSVKSRGIAQDIFGDYKDYVLPVDKLKNGKELLNCYKKLQEKENMIECQSEYTKNAQIRIQKVYEHILR